MVNTSYLICEQILSKDWVCGLHTWYDDSRRIQTVLTLQGLVFKNTHVVLHIRQGGQTTKAEAKTAKDMLVQMNTQDRKLNFNDENMTGGLLSYIFTVQCKDEREVGRQRARGVTSCCHLCFSSSNITLHVINLLVPCRLSSLSILTGRFLI